MTKLNGLWLREQVNPAIDNGALINQVTMAGLEVGGVEPIADGFHGAIVSKVVEYAQHPNANKLHMIKVNVGGDRLLNIVCGAPNCCQGLRVAVAIISVILPGGFKIEAAKLRGEPSKGMLRSFSKLNISDDHSGIVELSADAPIGTDTREYLRLDDNITEISVTPNRANYLDIVGVARDVAILNQPPLVQPETVSTGATIDDALPITVEVPETYPRHLGHTVRGINVKTPTPLWMKEKLRCYGVRSIDAVVDAINYVLLELGQPMYAFDRDHIEGGIVVRMAKEGETLVLLDGTETKLNADALVVASHNKALAMGGTSGGEHSGVNDETQSVLLECTFSSPLPIAGRVCRRGLHTDASHHYERSVDPVPQHKAMERATRLLIDICGGEIDPVTGVTNEAMLPECATITPRYGRLDHLTGYYIVDGQVTDTLRHLGCEMTKGKDEWQVVAPSQRFDMGIGEDLVEEVARVYGYNNIPDEPVQISLIMGTHRGADLSLKHVKALLNGKGYQEMIACSFVDPKM